MKHLLTAIFVFTIAVFGMGSNEIRSTGEPDEEGNRHIGGGDWRKTSIFRGLGRGQADSILWRQ